MKRALLPADKPVCYCFGPPETDVAGRRPHLQHGTASVQLAFGVEGSRPPLIAFAANMNVREVGGDVMTIAQIDAGANRERDIGRDVNRNISRRSFQPGLVGRGIGFSRTSRQCRPPRSQPAPRELRRVRSTSTGVSLKRALWRRRGECCHRPSESPPGRQCPRGRCCRRRFPLFTRPVH